MHAFLSIFGKLIVRSVLVLFVTNEIRGLLLAGPVLYAMYQAGGTLMAIWLAFCSLAGIALSVIVPLVVAKRLNLAQLRFAGGS
ncbi:hypothetical protein KRR38_17170 [Novosphingobium sp. G106]|uniref:hypothetical protein n=1 Tax=Novosphingobium sp. G106 TaxID=2849500 RepID=UPI001C2D2256|nr:hypothetical protein [Novosphingobium sp. G106]MBV1689355.1 hypothetical protein [Novosphingobium sp. G106]